jgi:hypothetical protein
MNIQLFYSLNQQALPQTSWPHLNVLNSLHDNFSKEVTMLFEWQLMHDHWEAARRI